MPGLVEEALAISVWVTGIRGSRNGSRGRHENVEYRLILDVSKLAFEIPDTWVTSPPDDDIDHVNIYSATECAVYESDLPKLCWGNFETTWDDTPRNAKTLGPK